MQAASTNDKARVLFVDDERRVLNSMRGMFRRDFDLFLTTEGASAIKIAAENPIDVIVADQRMPGMSGIEVLGKVKELSPDTIRILLTGYADPSAVEGSINVGEVFRFLGKPCPPNVLRETLDLAITATRSERLRKTATPSATPAPVKDPAPGSLPASGQGIQPPENRSDKLLSRLASIGEVAYSWDNYSRRRARSLDGLPKTSNKEIGVVIYTMDAQFAETALRTVSATRSASLATSLIKVMRAVENDRCGVLVTDISANGARLQMIIAALKQLRPELVMVVVSDTRDTTDMVNLINYGQVIRFIRKPVSPAQLKEAIEAAATRSVELRMNPELIRRHAVQVSPDAGNPVETVGRVILGHGG